ncbi:MAG: hypothetical protein A2096_11425 [Spirochaetes bacterium GWF1_41_5]|nr:MAG: hypothetical protein A2096_11425 [Spirochaetes bacterium GWF1_41_5]HBE02932.1 hypothetical protein [Spirochaetia bacterium]
MNQELKSGKNTSLTAEIRQLKVTGALLEINWRKQTFTSLKENPGIFLEFSPASGKNFRAGAKIKWLAENFEKTVSELLFIQSSMSADDYNLLINLSETKFMKPGSVNLAVKLLVCGEKESALSEDVNDDEVNFSDLALEDITSHYSEKLFLPKQLQTI